MGLARWSCKREKGVVDTMDLRSVGRVGTMLATAAFVVLATAGAAQARAITAPTSVNLGTVPSGATSISGQMGTVTATDSGTLLLLPSFTARVTVTTFTTGSGSASETIPRSAVSYWSGPATATSGAQTPVPGQATAALAQDLSTSRIAFSSTGLVLSISTSWKPTVIVTIPAAAVAGTYTATITHSVA
ncbi:hypothetical protein BH20ACT2_BH20ACT2_04460 [soil metagenome]